MSENVSNPRDRGHVVLAVGNDLIECVSTVTHLRKSGFDVIEAADNVEARRVVDSVHVDVVLVDLGTPGRTNGMTLLRWLRERHPAIKTILTSGTEMSAGAVAGYSIFLSKPYRLVDLDYCLRKVLAVANIPGNQRGGVTTADQGTKPASASSKAHSVSANSKSRAAFNNVDSSKQLIVDLSRRLGERLSRQSAADPIAAAETRRAALQAYDRTRKSRLIALAGVAMAAVVGSGITYYVTTIEPSFEPSPSDLTRTKPPSSLSIASVAPAPGLPDSPTPSGVASVVTATAKAEPTPRASQQGPVEPAANQAPLRRDEVREVQARLRSFGFYPGPVDGIPGRMSEDAVTRYQQGRGQPQTGKIDALLLEQLRQDPAPQVAYPATNHAARRPDPFEAVRVAGNRLGQWLGSLTR